ncbi:diuretic hormone 45 [Schistocerca nitens]|uniref:diuretic hormone 45 n=1 Tax=Schistocerca nitens TaxID=7011 RepID=UPI00211825FC|nr:diuretic hormone 45 [Schistocerca nitens]
MSPVRVLVAALLAVSCGGGCSAYYEAPPDGQRLLLQAAPAAAPAASAAAASWPHQQRRQAIDEFAAAAAAAADAQYQDEEEDGARRVKRMGMGPSLSIVNPMDVLRQRLLLEIARRRLRDAEEQIKANKDFLQQIGKRSPHAGGAANDADADAPPFGLRAAAERSASDISKDWASSDSRWNNQFTVRQS